MVTRSGSYRVRKRGGLDHTVAVLKAAHSARDEEVVFIGETARSTFSTPAFAVVQRSPDGLLCWVAEKCRRAHLLEPRAWRKKFARASRYADTYPDFVIDTTLVFSLISSRTLICRGFSHQPSGVGHPKLVCDVSVCVCLYVCVSTCLRQVLVEQGHWNRSSLSWSILLLWVATTELLTFV